ncbi:MAG: histidine kinase [Bacteroidota bacterium]
MLRIVPYMLIWMGGWLIYFPSADLNPLDGLMNGQQYFSPSSLAMDREIVYPASLSLWTPRKWVAWSPGNYLFLQRTLWKPLFWGSGVVMLAISILVFYRNKKLEVAHEENLLQKIRELERTALRAQMNPHFIFNALNSIQGFIVDGDKKSSSLYLSKFAKLVRSTLQHSDAKKITLAEDLQMLKNYLALEQLRFNGDFKFEIDIDPSIDPESETLPPMLIQPYVENAILHGLVPLQHNGLLTVRIQPHENGLLAIIRDNGIGVEASKKRKKQQSTVHRSMGMQVTQKRLELTNSSPTNQHFSIKEITGNEGEVTGTEVTLVIEKE